MVNWESLLAFRHRCNLEGRISGRNATGFVSVLFLLSGLSSLIYQVIWTRQLSFVFGSTTFASATVLSVFMGGLALGAFVAGRRSDFLRNPFLCYGLLEGLIGIWAIFAPVLFAAAIPFYKFAWQSFHLSLLPFSLLRFLVVSLILLLPTSCMGATLPLLSRFVTDSLGRVGERVGLLYALNTLGAVIGAVLTGFFLIPAFGLVASTFVAFTVNILLCAVVIFLCRSGIITSKDQTVIPELKPGISEREALRESERRLPHAVIATMIAFAFSGAVAMVDEVAWTRALLMVIGSTTYAFTIMLATFLTGLFAGSLILSRYADKLKDPFLWFAVLQLVLCAAQLLSVHLFNYLPYFNLVANRHFQSNPIVGMYIRFLLSGAVLVPVTIVLGAAFPLAVKICTRRLELVGRSAGAVYASNTCGAIVGAFAAGFLIIPLLGGELTLLCCAAASAFIGTVLMFLRPSDRKTAGVISLVLSVLLSFWLVLKPAVWDLKWIAISQTLRRGLQSIRTATPSYEQAKRVIDRSQNLLYWRDGACSNVAIMEEGGCVSLYTNGHVDASTSLDVHTQILLSALPLLLNPQAKSVGIVGWGSGATAGYSLLFPIEKAICVEIEKAVLDTSRFFHSINLRPEGDPRMCFEVNDGRNYLLATNETFDLIASEPSNPWQSGVCNLFTREFFQVCHDRLRPGGVFSMWCQYVEVPAGDLAHVLSALKRVYKHVVVFSTGTDMVAVCSDNQIKIKASGVAEVLSGNSTLRCALAENAAILEPEDLAAHLIMSDQGVSRIVKGVPPVTDDRNYLEFDVGRTYEQQSFARSNLSWLVQNAGPLWESVDWGNLSSREISEAMNRIAESALERDLPTAGLWATRSFAVFPNSHALQITAMLEAQKNGNFKGALAAADTAVKLFPGDTQARCMKGLIELMGGAPLSARTDFEVACRMSPGEKIYRLRLAETYLPQYRQWYQLALKPLPDLSVAESRPGRVVELLSGLAEDREFVAENPLTLAFLAAAKIEQGDAESGVKMMREYLTEQPGDRLARQILDGAISRKTNKR